MNSNVPDVALIDSAVRAISAYIVQEYTLEYLQSLFFSPDEQAFLTAVSRLVLPLTQNWYTHIILDVHDNGGGQIMPGNHLIIFLYSLDFPAHVVFKYSQSRTNQEYID